MRPLSHADHRKFVEVEGWTKKTTARAGKKTGDHFRYTLTLATGDVLYTRVSHGSGQIDDPGLVRSILRDQLHVTEEAFYDCVEKGVRPPRPQPEEPARPQQALDATLMRNLVRKVGLSADQMTGLSKEEAVAIWQQYLTKGGR
jgi:hypothetical protein